MDLNLPLHRTARPGAGQGRRGGRRRKRALRNLLYAEQCEVVKVTR